MQPTPDPTDPLAGAPAPAEPAPEGAPETPAHAPETAEAATDDVRSEAQPGSQPPPAPAPEWPAGAVVYPATYFDGISSQPFAAEVLLLPEAVHIAYRAPDGQLASVFWAPEQMKGEEMNNRRFVQLTYGERPRQLLEVDKPGFLGVLQRMYPDSGVSGSIYGAVLNIKPQRLVALAAGLIALVTGFYFFLLPPLAEFLAMQVPYSAEQKMAEDAYKAYLSQQRQLVGSSQHAQAFFRELVPDDPYGTSVAVVQAYDVNAFAMPGGHIVLHDTLLSQLQSPEELAALLGHEYYHVQGRHSMRAVSRNMVGYLFISAVFGDVSGVGGFFVQNVEQLQTLSHSRDLEREADRGALALLRRNGLPSQGMVGLMERLKANSPDFDGPGEWLSTHPELDERIREAQAAAFEGSDNARRTRLNERFILLKAALTQERAAAAQAAAELYGQHEEPIGEGEVTVGPAEAEADSASAAPAGLTGSADPADIAPPAKAPADTQRQGAETVLRPGMHRKH